MGFPAERVLQGAALPPRLFDLPIPPELLYIYGELPRGPAVAVVGTRRPSPPAERFARDLARKLAEAGVAILSGGALGIDTAAHRGALLARGATVVVAPAGFEAPYPDENRALFRRAVLRGGAYLSLVPSPTPATQAAFFLRNAVLAALAHVLVVVEAPLRSGARNAAACARRLGRPLFCAPAAPWHARGRGCVAELKLGARPLESFRDILRALGELHLHPVALPPSPGKRSRARQQTLDFSNTSAKLSDSDSVLRALQTGARFADEVCSKTGLPTGRVSELILTLRLEGVLVTDPSGRIEFVNPLI